VRQCVPHQVDHPKIDIDGAETAPFVRYQLLDDIAAV
jgi:hypothetical protein